MGKRELDHVIKVIKRVKEQGEPPSQSVTSFDLLECDLCKGDVEKSKLTQCPYCGRWICKDNCWNKKNLACISCSSIIELAQRKGEPFVNLENKNNKKNNIDVKGFLKNARHTIQKKLNISKD